MELYRGRPEDCTGRLEKEVRTYDLLDALDIPFYRTDHEPAWNMEVCNVIDAVLGVLICKNLFLCNRQKTRFYLLLMPGDKPFQTRNLSRQLGISRLSFGSPEDMERLLNLSPGSVSVMGLMNDTENQVQLVVDQVVLEQEEFGCHPCINTSSLKMKTADLVKKFLPAVHHDYISVTL